MAYEPPRRSRPSGNTPGNANLPGNNLLGGQHGNSQGGGTNGGNKGGSAYGGGGPQGGSDQFRDILHVLFKRKRVIGCLFLAVALPALLATLLRKPSYIASAKVMISTQRSDPTTQPTDLTRLDTIQLNESLVNSEVHVIGSRDLLERVVRRLASSTDGSASTKRLPFGEQVLLLSQNLVVTPIKASNVIQIDYKSSDAMAAARLVNRTVDEYLSYHASIHGNKGLSRFYDEQRRELEQHLRKSDEALMTFSETEGIVSPKDEIQATVRMVGEVGSSLRDVTTSISGMEERIRVVRDQLAAQPEVVKRSQYLEVNPVVTQLGAQLVDREVDRVTLLRKYTDKDRHIRDNTDEITDIRAQLDAELRERPTIIAHQLYRSNPIREERLHTLLDLESQVRELRAREASLDEEASRANRRLLTLSQKSVEYDRLEQEAKNWRDTYELYVKREQEARVGQAMDEQKLVNIDVIQRPALPLARADTQRISVAIALIAGLVVGLAAAFGREYMSRSLRSEGDVERYLGLPLMASIADTSKA